MKKSEQKLLAALVGIILLGAGAFFLATVIDPPATEEEIALAEGGKLYGREGHLATKNLLREVTDTLSGELDLSDAGHKRLFGEARGCYLEDEQKLIGGQWFISAWVTTSASEIEKSRAEVAKLKPELFLTVADEKTLELSNPEGELLKLTAISDDTVEVNLSSPCYGVSNSSSQQ